MVSNEQITIDGVRTRVMSSGNGPTVVLIHGLGGPQMWERIVEPLASHFRVISFHLPGFGEGDPTPRKFSTEEYAGFIERCIGMLDVTNVTLCGISYGSQVAIACAARYPKRISKLILIAPTGLGSRRWYTQSNIVWSTLEWLLRHTALRSRTILNSISKRSFYDIENRPDNFVDRFYLQIQGDSGRSYLQCLYNILACDVDIRQMASHMRAPTLLVWGANDNVVSVAMAADFHKIIPASKTIIIPECGHSLPLEKPDELCSSIIQFHRN